MLYCAKLTDYCGFAWAQKVGMWGKGNWKPHLQVCLYPKLNTSCFLQKVNDYLLYIPVVIQSLLNLKRVICDLLVENLFVSSLTDWMVPEVMCCYMMWDQWEDKLICF